jgi:hypothetical protein
MNRLWLEPIPLNLRGRAADALKKEADVLAFLGFASNEFSLDLVYWNMEDLKALSLYEPALLQAFTATRTNNHRWPLPEIRSLFDQCDRTRLKQAGDPLPGPGPFRIYRGVGGRGPARRVCGFSWTGSLERARWFADRAVGWGLHDPGVYQITVDESYVFAYVGSHRNEAEFIVMPSPAMKPKRIG